MNENKELQAESAQERSELLQIRRDKLAALRAEGRDPFLQTRYDRTSDSRTILENFDALENQDVSVAGRILSKRDMGKASFCHILDQQGQLQVYVKIDELASKSWISAISSALRAMCSAPAGARSPSMCGNIRF